MLKQMIDEDDFVLGGDLFDIDQPEQINTEVFNKLTQAKDGLNKVKQLIISEVARGIDLLAATIEVVENTNYEVEKNSRLDKSKFVAKQAARIGATNHKLRGLTSTVRSNVTTEINVNDSIDYKFEGSPSNKKNTFSKKTKTTQNYDPAISGSSSVRGSGNVQPIGNELAKLNPLLWYRVSSAFYIRLNINGIKFPNICRIEVSEKPYLNSSWIEVGVLRSDKKNKLYCSIHKSVLTSKSVDLHLLTSGLFKLGLIANSYVSRSIVPRDNSYHQTEFWQYVVQKELRVKLSFDTSNPTIAYTVVSCKSWEDQRYADLKYKALNRNVRKLIPDIEIN